MAVVRRGNFDRAVLLTAIFGVSYTYGDTKNVYVRAHLTSASASISAAAWTLRSCLPTMWRPPMPRWPQPKTVIEDRLVGLGITDYESYVDNNKNRIIVRFPWKNDEADFNPQTAIDEIGTTAKMVFRKGFFFHG